MTLCRSPMCHPLLVWRRDRRGRAFSPSPARTCGSARLQHVLQPAASVQSDGGCRCRAFVGTRGKRRPTIRPLRIFVVDPGDYDHLGLRVEPEEQPVLLKNLARNQCLFSPSPSVLPLGIPGRGGSCGMTSNASLAMAARRFVAFFLM